MMRRREGGKEAATHEHIAHPARRKKEREKEGRKGEVLAPNSPTGDTFTIRENVEEKKCDFSTDVLAGRGKKKKEEKRKKRKMSPFAILRSW